MVGRLVQNNPWKIQVLEKELYGDDYNEPPSKFEIIQMYLEHVEYEIEK